MATIPIEQAQPEDHSYSLLEISNGEFLLSKPLNAKTNAAIDMVTAFLWALLPTYFQTLIIMIHAYMRGSSLPDPPERKIRKTTFLNGIKGVASVIVLNYHYLSANGYYQGAFIPAHLLHEGENPDYFNSFLQWPIISLSHRSHGMVPIFFTISGYLLSFRAVTFIRAQNLDKLWEITSAGAVRRPFRLFIPTLIALAMLQISTWLGRVAPWHVSEEAELYGPGFVGALRGFWHRTCIMFNLTFYVDGYNGNLMQLWSIPVTYACSIVLTGLTVVMTRIQRPSVRMAITIALCAYTLLARRYGVFSFIVGWLIAEVESELEESTTGGITISGNGKTRVISHISYTSRISYVIKKIFFTCIFFIGLFLMSFPDEQEERDYFLGWLIPLAPKIYRVESTPHKEADFWCAIGAALFVYSCFKLKYLQNFFTTPLALYLGDLSFAVYLNHFRILWNVVGFAPAWGKAILGEHIRESQWGNLTLCIWELIILYFIVFWECDLFYRYVDQPTHTFAKWVETKLASM